MVDTGDSKSPALKSVPVRVRPLVPNTKKPRVSGAFSYLLPGAIEKRHPGSTKSTAFCYEAQSAEARRAQAAQWLFALIRLVLPNTKEPRVSGAFLYLPLGGLMPQRCLEVVLTDCSGRWATRALGALVWHALLLDKVATGAGHLAAAATVLLSTTWSERLSAPGYDYEQKKKTKSHAVNHLIIQRKK